MTHEIPANERFLSRWSRLKRAQEQGAEIAPPASSAAAPPVAGHLPATPGTPSGADAQTPALPDIESLTMESDFAQFFQPKVPETLRRAAVKKLFTDPHFNIMDGLDTYIDDYTKSDPIPPEMLAMMNHARDIIDHPSNRKPEPSEQPSIVPQEALAAVEQTGETIPVAQQDAQLPHEPVESAMVDARQAPPAAATERDEASAELAAATPDDQANPLISMDISSAADLPARPASSAA